MENKGERPAEPAEKVAPAPPSAESQGTEQRRPANDPQPATGGTRSSRKRGPKPDLETASRVAEIVARVAPDGDWRPKLDDICDALDGQNIPFPRTWRRKRQCRSWADCCERDVVVKAIEYRLRIANERKKAPPETLS